MEFSRRGPVTGGAGDGHRFPDPPPHGEREPMLVMRDALLSQLHMARLRQEIIEAELAKMERALALSGGWGAMAPLEPPLDPPLLALCAATGGHPTQTTPMQMPMPWRGVATADARRSHPWLFSAEQPMAQQLNAEFDEHKVPDSSKDALLSQLHMARLRHEIIETEVAQIERAMALCVATGGHQTLTTPMAMPWHDVDTTDAGRSKAGPFSTEQPVAQQDAEFDEHKFLDSNKAVPPSKASPAEKWELTGVTIPVKELKPPMKWNCTVCQVQATSEQNLQKHYSGKKHLSNVATLDPTTNKASDQKAKTAAEPSLGTKENKTSSIKWSCSTCQANGTSQTTLESHLKGKRHQQNNAATSGEGDKNLQQHYSGKKHLSNVETLDPTTNKASDQKAETAAEPSLGTKENKTSSIKWSCSTCQANGTSQTTLESHLKGKRHQQNNAATSGEGDKNLQQHCAGQQHLSSVATLDPTTNKASDHKAETAAEPSLGKEEKKTSSIKWSCSTCQAHGTSQSTLESHLKGRRHQQNIAATSVKGDTSGMPTNVAAEEAKSHSMNVPKHSEKPPSAWSCSICQVICTCEADLKNHLRGIRHREKVQSLPEQSNSMASASESRKSKIIPDSRWICSICHATCTCESDLEKHLAGQRHQLNIQVEREKIKQEKSNPPQIAKNQEPPSGWNCTMCEARCNSRSQFEQHCRSNRHQQKIQEMLGKGKIAKGSSSRTTSEVPSHGSSNGENTSSDMAEKQPALYLCEVCNVLFESSTMLVHHRFGKKHRAKLSARNESS